ncbi:MAG TPA: MFS transporter [Acidimicrobiales bacterium]|nr:MFS transporter [Acidimicrobiales bacterium]
MLGSRDFRWYFLGQTTSGFGSSLSGVALAFAVLSLTRSATLLGTVLLASRLPVIVLALAGGVLGDRFSRRLVMLGTDTGRTVLQGITAALLLSGHAAVWSLALVQAGAGAGSALFSPAANGLVPNLVAPEQLRRANSLLSMSSSLASIAAVGAAGAIVALVGPGAAFTVDAGTFAASAVSLALVRSQSLEAPPPSGRRLVAEVGEGWRAVRSRPWLLAYSLHVSLLNTLVLSPLFVLGPLVADQRLGGAGAWAGIAMSYAVGSLCGGAIVLRWHPERPMLATFAVSLALAPLPGLLAVPVALWWLAPAALLAGAETSVYNTLATTAQQADVPDRLRSRTGAFVTVGALAGVPVGMGLAGVVAGALGTRSVLGFAAAWVVLSALGAAAVPAVRRLGSDGALQP